MMGNHRSSPDVSATAPIGFGEPPGSESSSNCLEFEVTYKIPLLEDVTVLLLPLQQSEDHGRVDYDETPLPRDTRARKSAPDSILVRAKRYYMNLGSPNVLTKYAQLIFFVSFSAFHRYRLNNVLHDMFVSFNVGWTFKP